MTNKFFFKKRILIAVSIIVCLFLGYFSFYKRDFLSKKEVVLAKTLEEKMDIIKITKEFLHEALLGEKKKEINFKNIPLKWKEKKGVYVSIYIDGELRGCQGILKENKPFIYSLRDASYKLVEKEKRFDKLTLEDLNEKEVEIVVSVLSSLHQINFKDEKDLLKKIVPFRDGLFLTDHLEGQKEIKALFLPTVWKKRDNVASFWRGLKIKAGLNPDYLSDTIKVFYFTTEEIRDEESLKRKDEKRINQAIEAFKKLVRLDGTFEYEISFLDSEKSKKNNIVREMGSGYGLAYAYYLTKDASIQPIMKRFLKSAEKRSEIKGEQAFVNEKGEIKIGANALLLLSLLYYEQASGDLSFALMREKWLNAILSLYRPEKGILVAPNSDKTSPYFDGESWLALARYVELYPENKKAKDVLENLDETMIKKYQSGFRYNFFHWGTQAASQRYLTTKNEKFLTFLKEQSEVYIEEIPIKVNSGFCAYLEGMADTAVVIKNTDTDLYQKLVKKIKIQTEVPRTLQLNTLKIKNNKNQKIHPSKEKLLGLFLNRPKKYNTRNDVTQHCLVALLKVQNLKLDEGEAFDKE